jgi:ribose transport system substrate-binding protein
MEFGMRKILFFVFFISSMFLFAEDTKTETEVKESPHVIISVRTDANEYMRALVDGAKMFADSIGSSHKVISLFNYGDSEKQVLDLQLALQKTGSNAIIVMDPNDESIALTLANIAKEHEVYFSTIWNKPKDLWPWDIGKYWVTHTTPDYVYSGTVTAEQIFSKIANKGNILVVEGRPDNSSNKGRVKGLNSVLEKNPKIKILDQRPANWSRLESAMLVTKWFTKYSIDEVDGIWAANDEMALGVVDIIKEIGQSKKIPICGVDGTSEAVEAVISKDLTCTVSVDPYWQSGMGLSFAYQAYLGKLNPSRIPHEKRAFFTKSKLITNKNAKHFLENYIHKLPKIDYSKLWKDKYNRAMK